MASKGQNLDSALKHATKVMSENLPPDPLATMHAQQNKIEQEIKEHIARFNSKCSNGLVQCIDAVQQLASFDPEINLPNFKDNLTNAFEKIGSSETMQKMTSNVMQGNRLCNVMELNKETMNAMFKGAKHLLANQRYPDAEAAFCLLTTLDGGRFTFWVNLGHCCFRLGHYKEAVSAYRMASMCEQSNAWAHIFIANCFEAQKEHKQVINSLEQAINCCQESGQKDSSLEESLRQRLTSVKVGH